MLNIHQITKDKLNYFHKNHKIPNIIFHGPSGSGKSTLLNDFLNQIYDNNNELLNNYVMSVNCVYGKGIKFIREELKFFAKTNIQTHNGNIFKSVVLLNGDKLTIDAQSALRRCIELFSHNTRFFIIVENKNKLLKPILSRFCSIYVPLPIINNISTNLYTHKINTIFKNDTSYTKHLTVLKKKLLDVNWNIITNDELIKLVDYLYDKSFSTLNIFDLLNTSFNLDEQIKNKLLFIFDKIKYEFKNEKMLLLFVLNFIFIDNNINLEQLIK